MEVHELVKATEPDNMLRHARSLDVYCGDGSPSDEPTKNKNMPAVVSDYHPVEGHISTEVGDGDESREPWVVYTSKVNVTAPEWPCWPYMYGCHSCTPGNYDTETSNLAHAYNYP